MSDQLRSEAETVTVAREMRAVQLVGFSTRDRELLRLFLRRPPRAGVSLSVVDTDADLLIGNTATVEARDAFCTWGRARPAIGIVERFESDATYYQIAQDGQMLFSLAQAINRIRAGWTPPIPVSASVEGADVDDGATAASVAAGLRESTEPNVNAASGQASGVPANSNRSVAAVSGDGTLAATATGISAALPWQRALNILVIDDSHFSREAIAAALVKVGFAVDTAEDGANGVRRAAEKLFDVALVDFEMPGMKGPEVLRKLRALGAKAPTLLIMLTSRTGAVDRLRAKFAGCDAYMTKPTRMQEFLKILRDFANAGKLSRS